MLEFKEIPGTNGDYLCSNEGHILSMPKEAVCRGGKVRKVREKLLSTHLTEAGYLRIDIRGTKYLIHRLVAELFVDQESPEKDIVNHKDGDKQNCHYTNLEWVTQLENVIHAIENGHRTLKLNQEEIDRICNMYAAGKRSKKIAEEFNISQGYCQYVLRNNKAPEIPEELLKQYEEELTLEEIGL